MALFERARRSDMLRSRFAKRVRGFTSDQAGAEKTEVPLNSCCIHTTADEILEDQTCTPAAFVPTGGLLGLRVLHDGRSSSALDIDMLRASGLCTRP